MHLIFFYELGFRQSIGIRLVLIGFEIKTNLLILLNIIIYEMINLRNKYKALQFG